MGVALNPLDSTYIRARRFGAAAAAAAARG